MMFQVTQTGCTDKLYVVGSTLHWDLFSLGKTILDLLRIMTESREGRPLSPYCHRYLKLLACRLLDGKNSASETLLGLSVETFGELRYASAADALQDLRKLTGAYNLESRIPELNPYGPDTIQASTLATTPFTPRVKVLIEDRILLRLGGFTQLSLLNLVYPTASHTRLEHTIGAFSMMARYLVALYNDPLNPIFKQIMTEEDMKAALLTALLHDIGHYGLAHDLEEAYPGGFSHEERGRAILRDDHRLAQLIGSTKLENGAQGWAVSSDRILAILEADPSRSEGSLRDRILHSLIDGPIDADKLDYIIRDSANLGLTYGRVIDVERLLRSLTVVTQLGFDGRTYATLGLHAKGRVTAEAMAFARYALYGSVYWHHTFRSIKAMLVRMAWEYVESVSNADRQKKEGVGKTIRGQLDEFLQTKGSPQTLPFTSWAAGTQIHPGDLAVLHWLRERSGATGKLLAELIENRRPFKRVLVISRAGKEELWREITKLLGRQEDWQRKLQFQRVFQTEVVAFVTERSEPELSTSIIFADERNRFLAAANQEEILLLVDAPPSRPGAKRGLELVDEDDRRRALVEEFTISNLEKSKVWESLRDQLQESIGKVRVFCHPDHQRFLSAFLSRDTLEKALDRALQGVT